MQHRARMGWHTTTSTTIDPAYFTSEHYWYPRPTASSDYTMCLEEPTLTRLRHEGKISRVYHARLRGVLDRAVAKVQLPPVHVGILQPLAGLVRHSIPRRRVDTGGFKALVIPVPGGVESLRASILEAPGGFMWWRARMEGRERGDERDYRLWGGELQVIWGEA